MSAIRIDLGCPGHFIGVIDCHYRRHTQILGPRCFRVSTVGDYFPRKGARKPLGGRKDEFFETMVFETLPDMERDNDNCGCRIVKDYSGLDSERYVTAGAAHEGHERYVQKYLALSDSTWEEHEG